MKEPEILEVTMIDFHEESITKKGLLKKFEEAFGDINWENWLR